MSSVDADLRSPHRTGSISFTIELREPERVVSRMPVAPGVLNPFGTVQAGALIWLADVTATVLALGDQHIGAEGQGFPLAVDLHTALIANQRDGDITAEARFVRRGRRVIVVRTVVRGRDDRLLAEVTTTHIPA